MCDCQNYRSMDLKTPRNTYLTAFYKRSFAFHTVKNRLPVIVTQTLDNLTRSKEDIKNEFGPQAAEELKDVIGEISKLKYEIQTNKPLALLSGTDDDIGIYNNWILRQASEEGNTTYFHTIWLLSECYMYRRIRAIFQATETLQTYDYFSSNKELSFKSALPMIQQMGVYILALTENEHSDSVKAELMSLLKLNLWGNKCDLSLSLGKDEGHTTLFDTDALEPYVLVDHSQQVLEVLLGTDSDIVDLVFDNAGYELFTDLCLADYLITKHFAKKIRFYVKMVPWFISDVMTHDVDYLLSEMQTKGDPNLAKLAERWLGYLRREQWTLEEHNFWTLPFEFSYMASVDPALYKKLGEAKLVIYKGDLNYRKLFGEKNWDPTTPIDVALEGYHPAKMVVLRTLKADIICGLEPGVAEKLEAENAEWCTSGEYGVIQFSDKIIVIN